MKKLRKMLGDISSQECIDLMHLIETQSQQTLATWAIQYVKDNYLALYDQYCPTGEDFHFIIANCEDYLANKLTLKEVKTYLKVARTIAKDISDPIGQAAARALATACATITTPTNALGFVFYGAAVYAYCKVGLNESPQTYDLLALEEIKKATHSLQSVAIENETNPAKIKWNC